MSDSTLFLGVAHVNVQAPDLEKAVKFYTEVLGCALVNRMELGPVKLVFLNLGGTVLELKEAPDRTTPQDGLVDHIALQVTDIFAAVELLKSQGVEFITPEPTSIGPDRHIFFFRGPSGEKIELMQG